MEAVHLDKEFYDFIGSAYHKFTQWIGNYEKQTNQKAPEEALLACRYWGRLQHHYKSRSKDLKRRREQELYNSMQRSRDEREANLLLARPVSEVRYRYPYPYFSANAKDNVLESCRRRRF